jgi:hypothetical protein
LNKGDFGGFEDLQGESIYGTGYNPIIWGNHKGRAIADPALDYHV